MGFFAESCLTELLVALSLVVAAVYMWFSHSYKYWHKKGVPFLEPSFPFGNVYNSFVGRQSMPMVISDAYQKFKGKRFGGLYVVIQPTLVAVDPDFIRDILVKDFGTFHDRGIKVDEKEPLGKHLFLLGGSKWRRLRVKLTPTFTSGKMKMMFQGQTNFLIVRVKDAVESVLDISTLNGSDKDYNTDEDIVSGDTIDSAPVWDEETFDTTVAQNGNDTSGGKTRERQRIQPLIL